SRSPAVTTDQQVAPLDVAAVHATQRDREALAGAPDLHRNAVALHSADSHRRGAESELERIANTNLTRPQRARHDRSCPRHGEDPIDRQTHERIIAAATHDVAHAA